MKKDGESPRPYASIDECITARHVGDASAVRLGAAYAQAIREPSSRNDEQRRQKEAEQRIQPNQRDVEAAEANADP